MQISQRYSSVIKEAFQRHYDEKSDVWTADIGMRVLPLLIEGKLRMKSHYRLLDIGCGTGEDALIYSSLCAQVTGVDICQHSCWDTVKKACGNVNFYCTDFMEFNNDDGFNVIVDNGCLHHQTSDEIPAYLRKVRSSLTHNGCFVASTFYDPDKHTYTDGYCRIHHYFSTEELDEKFIAAGFKIMDSVMIYRPKYQNYYRITFCSLEL